MCHVSAQGVDERMINVQHCYYYYEDDDDDDVGLNVLGCRADFPMEQNSERFTFPRHHSSARPPP